MARVRMVTRTVNVTVAEVMFLDVESATVTTETLELSGDFANNEQILKFVNQNNSTASKAVAVKSTSTKEVLYGMLEEDFIKNATVLPPRTATEN